ncbi:ATP-binding protein [Moraxella oblonga]|uniref:ATP-binding protein n=1 Tax=Moraxella oblonga TaxID=200413 RepID=UPI000835944B|nr:ATP-binding protein [Moraxella oblonga]
MAIFSFTERSIFFRIYSGLLLVCLSVAFFAYLFVDTINQERIQSYRESVATGVFYLIGQGVAKQTTADQKRAWLEGAGKVFGSPFYVSSIEEVGFKARELKRLSEEKSVVRYNAKTHESLVYQSINNEQVLWVKVGRVGERQVRAMTMFLLDDLSYYPTLSAKQERLAFLSKKNGYSVSMELIERVGLDSDQIAKLIKNEPVIFFKDSVNTQEPSISVIIASDVKDSAIVVGPVPIFNYFPLNLVASVVLISLLLISLGVYALIFPLERRLQLLQAGVDRVAKGELDTSVQVVGRDDIARLSSTFNAMTKHIKRLIESQRELTRAVSHELRTPVARIRFAVDMLADEDDYEFRQSQREQIDKDIESLNELIDEILTYAKLEEGSPKMDWEMVNLRELLEQVERETNALGKSITIKINAPSSKVVAMADRRYLHRVVQNLAGNALRYANSTIIISAGVKKGVAFVSVEDDGQGIPKADREKVFIPFARLDDSRTRASGGYGLGLSIVSRIAFWFGGNMSVGESPSLRGAHFKMTWPVKQVGVTVLADKLTQEKSEKKLLSK